MAVAQCDWVFIASGNFGYKLINNRKLKSVISIGVGLVYIPGHTLTRHIGEPIVDVIQGVDVAPAINFAFESYFMDKYIVWSSYHPFRTLTSTLEGYVGSLQLGVGYKF